METKNKIKFETNVKNVNGTRYLRVPPALADHLGFQEGTRIIAIADVGKHGKFLACWEAPTTEQLIKKTIKETNK